MTYRGSCADMCPEAERQSRFGLYMSIFEKDSDNQPDEYAMVKEYRRSGADQKEPEAGDLRTPSALSTTMDYLVCNIMDDPRSSTQEQALEWYDFLWDRLRAIRKDITQQNICDHASAILVERCARFHVHSCYAMNNIKNFDVDMNKRNLNDCLQMLRQMYHDLKINSGEVCPGELEFQKYDILLHLNEDHLTSTVLMKTSDYRSSSEMKFIIKTFNAYTNNDFYKFFRQLEQADYMTACILSLYANKMRVIGFKSIINACSPRQSTLYSYNMVIKSLGFDDAEDLKSFASYLDIETQEKDGNFYLVVNRDLMQTLRRKEKSLYPFKSKSLVDNKSNRRLVGQLVDGRESLPTNPYRTSPMQTFSTDSDCNETSEIESMHYSEELNQDDMDQSPIITTSTETCDKPNYINRLQDVIMSVDQVTDIRDRIDESIKNYFQVSNPNVPVQEKEVTSQISFESPIEELKKMKVLEPLKRKRDRTPEIFDQAPHPKRKIEKQIVVAPKEERLVTESNQEVEPVDENKRAESPSPTESPDHDYLMDIERLRAHRKEIADIMPVGPYKVRSLRARVPTLKLPPVSNKTSTLVKRRNCTAGPQKMLESLGVDIGDEARANEMLAQLEVDFTNSIKDYMNR